MTLIIIVLFLCAMAGGYAVNLIPEKHQNIRYPLVFAGSFLFSITIIHMLPEVFSLSSNPMKVGLYILLGFFLQQFLEYFTSGIEHGHFHARATLGSGTKINLLIALIIHSLLEGALLTHNSPFHEPAESYALLMGIVLHKIPAAFALMATLRAGSKFTAGMWLILILFSLASPVGLLLSAYLVSMSSENLLFLFALVSGGFLHISTTIFVESSPNHHFGLKKFLVSLTGAAFAIMAEYLF